MIDESNRIIIQFGHGVYGIGGVAVVSGKDKVVVGVGGVSVGAVPLPNMEIFRMFLNHINSHP